MLAFMPLIMSFFKLIIGGILHILTPKLYCGCLLEPPRGGNSKEDKNKQNKYVYLSSLNLLAN